MGNLHSFIDQTWPPRPRFGVGDVPDLAGRVMLVTGGLSGIGREIAKVLLGHDARVYVAGFRSELGKHAIDVVHELRAETQKETIYFLELDLADLEAVKRCADEFLSKETRLDALFNNAGVMGAPIDRLTAQGYDLQFGTNCLGNFYLTKLLLPILIETTKCNVNLSSNNSSLKPFSVARIVNITSTVHMFGKLEYNTFRDGPERQKKSSAGDLYPQSKLGIAVMARELARRYGGEGIVSTAVNPGHVRSNLDRNVNFLHRYLTNLIFMYPTPLGALTPLWAGTADESLAYNGKYLIPWARVGEPSTTVNDPVVGTKLWDWLEEQVKTYAVALPQAL